MRRWRPRQLVVEQTSQLEAPAQIARYPAADDHEDNPASDRDPTQEPGQECRAEVTAVDTPPMQAI